MAFLTAAMVLLGGFIGQAVGAVITAAATVGNLEMPNSEDSSLVEAGSLAKGPQNMLTILQDGLKDFYKENATDPDSLQKLFAGGTWVDDSCLYCV